MTNVTPIPFTEIAGATHNAGADQDEYLTLPIRAEQMDDGSMVLVSEWTPTEEQRQSIASGASIYLGISGMAQPPVMLSVGPRSELEGADNDG